MKFKLNENIFDLLNKINLDEELDPSINGNEILYEDNDYSKTPAEADNYRTTVEEVLGIGELNGNLVLYLADNWPGFYKDAKKYELMRDLILSFMQDENLLSEDQLKEFNLDLEDDLDDIDFEDTLIENGDILHPQLNGEQTNFQPLNVLSWDSSSDPEQVTNGNTLDDMANEYVEEDDFDPEDEDLLNNILSRENKG